MAALDYLHLAGLTVEAVADKLRVSPRERITPEARQYITDHKVALLAELTAAMPPQPRTWLHLLALADGRVIQRTGDLDVATVEEKARQQFGEELLAVVPVPGFERLLSLEEIAKALASSTAAAVECLAGPCRSPARHPTDRTAGWRVSGAARYCRAGRQRCGSGGRDDPEQPGLAQPYSTPRAAGGGDARQGGHRAAAHRPYGRHGIGGLADSPRPVLPAPDGLRSLPRSCKTLLHQRQRPAPAL